MRQIKGRYCIYILRLVYLGNERHYNEAWNGTNKVIGAELWRIPKVLVEIDTYEGNLKYLFI